MREWGSDICDIYLINYRDAELLIHCNLLSEIGSSMKDIFIEWIQEVLRTFKHMNSNHIISFDYVLFYTLGILGLFTILGIE